MMWQQCHVTQQGHHHLLCTKQWPPHCLDAFDMSSATTICLIAWRRHGSMTTTTGMTTGGRGPATSAGMLFFYFKSTKIYDIIYIDVQYFTLPHLFCTESEQSEWTPRTVRGQSEQSEQSPSSLKTVWGQSEYSPSTNYCLLCSDLTRTQLRLSSDSARTWTLLELNRLSFFL